MNMKPLPLKISCNNFGSYVCIIVRHTKQKVWQKEKNALQFLADVDFSMRHYHSLYGFYPLKVSLITQSFLSVS